MKGSTNPYVTPGLGKPQTPVKDKLPSSEVVQLEPAQ